MTAPFSLHFALPKRTLCDSPVHSVELSGSEGDLTVMRGHIPMVIMLRPGLVQAQHESSGGKEDYIFRVIVLGGFAEIQPDKVTVLADQAFDVGDFSVNQLDDAIAQLEAQIPTALSEMVQREIQDKILQLADAKITLGSLPS